MSDHIGQPSPREGFAQEKRSLRENPLSGNELLRVPGHEQDPQVGHLLPELLRQLGAVHVRHDDIGEQKVKGSGCPGRMLQGVQWGVHRRHLVPQAGQHSCREDANCRFILND